MEYNSVTDYFSRLQTKSLIFFFISVLLFLTLYYLMLVQDLTPVMPDESGMLVSYVLSGVALLDGLMSFFLVKMLLAKVTSMPGLGDRMDRYAKVSFLRFTLLISGSLMLMVAFYLSGNPQVLAFYGAYLFLFLFAWPTRSKLCAELKLKESEREVVYGN